jgi:hypothetical protein
VVSVGDSESDAYWKAISRQAADRAARHASGAISGAFGHSGTRFGDAEKRFSRRRSLDWVLTVGLGIILYAGILYLTLGMHLHSNPVEATRDSSGQTTLNEGQMIGASVVSSHEAHEPLPQQ